MHIRQLLAAAAFIALSSTLGLAQVHQIDMGHSMDANPQVGYGGANRPVPGFVPINGNDIMTGNVSGLAYFHGPTATITPYQSSSLGFSRDPIANFVRQSAGTPYNGAYTGITQPYYLPSATVSTAGGALYSAPIGSGFDSALVPRYSISPTATPLQLTAINGTATGAQFQAIDRRIDAQPLDAGQPGNLLASPLFVLRNTDDQAKRRDIGQPLTPDNGMTPPGLSTNSGAGFNPTTQPSATQPATQPLDPNEVQAMVGGTRDLRVSGQSEELRTAMVSEAYLQLANQLNSAPGVPGTQPGTATQPSATEVTATNLPNRSGMDIDPLTGKPRLISTLPSLNGRGSGAGRNGAGATTQTALSNRGGMLTPKRLSDATDAELLAGAKVPPVHMVTESKTQVSGFDLMMTRAENNLKAGRFLDAAESYQAALAIKPDDPLALVGRAHAEMGAGIYTAAEYDLKFVFTRKPELVSVHYDVNSFIPGARQEFLLEDLKKLTDNKDTANMASFLYCYLCYQSGRNTQLQAELKAWAARDSHDDWEAIGQRAWAGTK